MPHLNPEGFYKPNLLGGFIEYDMLLNDSNCGCVAAFYTVLMPGRKENGQYDPSENGMFYCDANKVGGNYCPEFDLMEANLYAFQTTPHSCDKPSSAGFYSKCDKTGDC